MSSISSAELGDSVSDSSEPVCEPSPSARSSHTQEPSSQSTGRACPVIPMSASFDELVSALKSTAHVLSQMMLRNSAMDGLAKEALNEADKALALMGS